MKRFKLVLMLMMSLVMMKSLDAQSIRVLPVPESNITNVAAEMLYDRLNQVVALNGVSSVDNSNKFLLVPKVTVLSIEPTPMFPIRFVAEVEISLFLVDNSRNLVISQEMLTKKGVAENEKKAVNEAIKSIKTRDAKLKKFIVNGKNKILEYYNAECDKVVETINTYIEMEMYDAAMNELNAVPQIDAELDCYKNSMDILNKISKEQQAKSNDNIKNETPDVSWIMN